MTSTLEYGTEYASRIIMGFTAVSRMEVRRELLGESGGSNESQRCSLGVSRMDRTACR